jgi:hypothetical protein
MKIIIDADGNVRMWSTDGDPAPGDGQTSVELTPDQETALLEQTAIPNNGLIFRNGSFSMIAPAPSPPPLTVDQKLAAVGLTPADLKQALGLS